MVSMISLKGEALARRLLIKGVHMEALEGKHENRWRTRSRTVEAFGRARAIFQTEAARVETAPACTVHRSEPQGSASNQPAAAEVSGQGDARIVA